MRQSRDEAAAGVGGDGDDGEDLGEDASSAKGVASGR